MEGDNGGDFQRIVKPTFQSTPSAWRVTGFALLGFQQIVISIHTLRVEGDSYYNYLRDVLDHISIHTLRVEGDHRPDVLRLYRPGDFNPHPSRGG